MAHDVFISYSTPNRAVAVAACEALEREGFRCWIAPRDVPPAAHFAGAIVQGIKGSRALVLVFSVPANDSPHVLREVERAVAYRVPILPFRIEELLPSGDFEYFIGITHWLNALPPPPESHLPALVAAVRGLLGEARRASPDVPPVTRPAVSKPAPRSPSSEDFTELTPQQAPLAEGRSDSLGRFNRLAGLLRKLTNAVPGLLERQELHQCIEDFRLVRDRLTRPRYRVLLLGPAQAGKSATLNNLLGADPSEPSPVGMGMPTTGTPIRLRGSPLRTRPAVRVRFLTPSQYGARRTRLCQVTRFDPALSDEEILGLLAERTRQPAAWSDGPLPAALDYLRQLLTTYRHYGPDHVSDPPRVDEVPYEERARYHPHPMREGTSISPALLVQDVVIDLPSEVLPPQLELIDLPGLASEWLMDTFVTEGLLDDLDGMLVFLPALRLDDRRTQHLLTLLRPTFAGGTEGRVWLILTQADLLSQEHLEGDAFGRSFGDVLAAFLNRNSLPASQVCMVSSALFARPGMPVIDPGPTAFGRAPELLRAYHELGSEGGIRRLRGVLVGDLPDGVAEQTRRATETHLAAIAGAVQEEINRDQRRAEEGLEGLRNALLARQVLLEALQSGPRWRELLARLGRDLREGLQRVLAEVLPERLDSIALSRLVGDFPLHANLLNHRLRVAVDGTVLPGVYRALGEPLERLPPVRVLDAAALWELWDRYGREDMTQDGWRRGRMADFAAGAPFGEMANVPFWDGRAYRELMTEKIDVASRQAVHAVYRRGRERLASLVSELDALVRDVGPATSAHANLQGLLQELAEVGA